LNDAGPNLPSPVRTAADVEKLHGFDPEVETGFLPEAIRRIVKTAGPEVPVLGFAAAPWTLACYMVEGKRRRILDGKELPVPRTGHLSDAAAQNC